MAPYQGTVSSVQKAVIDRLKMETQPADQTRVLEWINLAYVLAVQETGCLQGCGVTALTADAGGYTLAPEVQQIKAITYANPDGTISRPFEKVTLDEILQLRLDDTPGPRCRNVYAILGQSRLELWPEPAAGAAIRFWYVYLPPALVSPTDTFLIAEPYGSKLLEVGACVEGAKFKKDPLLQSYQQEYDAWMRRFQGWLNRRRTGTGDSFTVVVDNFDDDRPALQLVG